MVSPDPFLFLFWVTMSNIMVFVQRQTRRRMSKHPHAAQNHEETRAVVHLHRQSASSPVSGGGNKSWQFITSQVQTHLIFPSFCQTAIYVYFTLLSENQQDPVTERVWGSKKEVSTQNQRHCEAKRALIYRGQLWSRSLFSINSR